MESNLQDFVVLLYVFCTFFAACVGSFANVVIYRVPNHLSIVSPPSACPKCGQKIKPYDNIPILSWLILRGKCRNCKNKISIQYPIIEFICAMFGLYLCHTTFGANAQFLFEDGIFWRLCVHFFVMLVFAVTCLILAVIDIQKTEIPPEIALPVAAFGFGTSFILPQTYPFSDLIGNVTWIDSIVGASCGGAIVVLIIAGYYLATKRIGMGGGDVWILVMIGAFLGWESLPFVFLASRVQGIIAAVVAIALGKKQQTDDERGLFRNAVANEINDAPLPEETSKLAIPYGPFLALAAVEYIAIGKWLLPLMTGGMISPSGFQMP